MVLGTALLLREWWDELLKTLRSQWGGRKDGGLFQEGVGARTERPVRAGKSCVRARVASHKPNAAAAVASAGLGVWVPEELCSLQGTWWFHWT